jgi:copper chaperone CopZ
MKTLFVSFALIMSSFLSFAQIQSATLTASGLTCSMCSKSIFKAIEKLASVQSVEVDIDQSVFQIQFKDKAHVQPDDIKRAVTDAGFAIASLHIKARFVPDAAFKQYKKMTKMHCIETGKLASCCPKEASVGSRVYHILF